MTESDKQEIIRECGKTDRTFLYLMVFVTLLYSCNTSTKSDIQRIESKIDKVMMK